MPLNQSSIFPPSRDINITFDWLDLASGLGYIQYDCFGTLDDSGITYMLVESRNSSDLFSMVKVVNSGTSILTASETSSAGVSNATFQKIMDLDFDTTTFNNPRTISGRFYLNLHGGIYALGGGKVASLYIIAKVRKWDGASETDLVTVTSNTVASSGATQNIVKFAMLGDIPQTLIKKGETLRLTLELWGKEAGGTEYHLGVCGDPADAAVDVLINGLAWAAGTTRIVFAVPYKID